ncbi:MAG: DUF2085 domain-containing protein [Acidobacteriota bacterium]
MSAAVVERKSLAGRATPVGRRAIAIWALTAAFGLALVGLIVGAPLAASSGHLAFATAIYKAFSFVCHQIPERSFHLAEHKFAVCSRCTGLYAGFAVAALGYPLIRPLKLTDTPRRLWLILAAVPLTIDFALGYFSIWQNNHLSRFLTGALLSSVAVFYVIPGLIDLSSAIARRFGRARTSEARP